MTFLGYWYDKTTRTFEIIQDTMLSNINVLTGVQHNANIHKTFYIQHAHATLSYYGSSQFMYLFLKTTPPLRTETTIDQYKDMLLRRIQYLRTVIADVMKKHDMKPLPYTLLLNGFTLVGNPKSYKIYVPSEGPIVAEDLSRTITTPTIIPVKDLPKNVSDDFYEDHQEMYALLETLLSTDQPEPFEELVVGALTAHLHECGLEQGDPVGGFLYSYNLSPIRFTSDKVFKFSGQENHNYATDNLTIITLLEAHEIAATIPEPITPEDEFIEDITDLLSGNNDNPEE